jgi:hypothetical protein
LALQAVITQFPLLQPMLLTLGPWVALQSLWQVPQLETSLAVLVSHPLL